MIARLLLLVGTAMLAAPALAQDTPWTLHDALGAPDDLKISGSIRGRYEALDGQFRPGLDNTDDILLFRTTLFAEYDAGPIRLGGELFDSRAYDVDPGSPVGTGEVNTFELVQAYVTADLDDGLDEGSTSSLTAGRFTMDLGSRRLVGRNNFRNTTNAFTGLRLDHAGRGGDTLTLFYTLPQIRLPSDKESILDNDTEWDDASVDLAFWGAFYNRPGLVRGLDADVYFFGLDEDDDGERATRDRELYTPGIRLFTDPAAGKVDYEFEAAYQFGTIRASTAPGAERLDVSAHFLHAEVGYGFDAPWKPRIALEYDLASGDDGEGSFNRFDSLYGVRRADYGPSSIYGPLGRSNISSPGVRLEAKPSDRWDGFIFYRAAWLDERKDSFASTGVRDPLGESGSFAGHQIEARARYWLIPKLLRLDVGGAVLFAGEFLKNAPNATGFGDTHYAYFDITATF